MPEGRVKKVFFVAGELSGDKIAAWYIKKHYGALNNNFKELVFQGIGGNQMLDAGVELYARFETLNVTGTIEILRHVPRLWRLINDIISHIELHNFTEVVLIDFPGFNLRLARQLKKIIPSITITYVSPPQLWCWGAWRIKNLKRYCTNIVVMYPFEVAWYKQRGIDAVWLGSPVYEALESYINNPPFKENKIALLMGSRKQEIEMLAPIFAQCLKKLAQRFPEVSFVIPLASSIDDHTINEIFMREGVCMYRSRITIVRGEETKIKQLQTCCCALSKPGTVTLELALLKIPTVIVYKTSWITYALARIVVNIQWMGLPNLLLGKEIFKEHIQRHSSPALVTQSVSDLYTSFIQSGHEYKNALSACDTLKDMLNHTATKA